MRNYIELMKLRCNKQTSVDYQFLIANGQAEVAPLLFISLIENAFKHGVSSGRPSVISISLEQDGRQLTFVCDNTNYPKSNKDRSGSGIGIENTHRRLELMIATAASTTATRSSASPMPIAKPSSSISSRNSPGSNHVDTTPLINLLNRPQRLSLSVSGILIRRTSGSWSRP